MKTIYYFLILTFCAFLLACSSGKKALEKGDYDKAVNQAINRLRSKNDNEKAQKTLRNAYQLATNLHLDNVQRAKSSFNVYKWEIIEENYDLLNYLYSEIRRCPGCLKVVPNPVNYDREWNTAKLEAAEVRYQLGTELMRMKNDRKKAMEAHRHFIVAHDLMPRYKDVENQLQEALYYATLKVVVEPIPSPARMMNIQHEFFVNKINEYLHNTTINPYVQFYTPGEIKSQQIDRVDHVVRMEFDQFSLGNISSHTVEREVGRDSVEIAKKDGKPIYGTVKAKLAIHDKAITGNGVLDFKIFDPQLNKVVSQEKFPSQYRWAISWASYNGDERALSKEELNLVNTRELDIPNSQMMFEQFTIPLYDQVINKIKYYYRN